MRNAIDSFRGEAPRLTPRALPANGSQAAVNARLLSGDLEAWRQFALEQALENTGPVLSIFRHGEIWLAWDYDVDVASGAIAGDTTGRIFLTGPDTYDRPRWTNTALAGAGNGPPTETRPLGVPAPDGSPVVAAGIDPNPTTFNVDVSDDGGQLAASWTASPFQDAHGGVTQVIDQGSPDGYQLLYDDNPGAPAYLFRNFGVGSANVARMSFDFRCTSGSENYLQMVAGLARSQIGAGIYVALDYSGAFQLGTASGWSTYGAAALSSINVGTPLFNTTYTCEIAMINNADGTQTVTATLSIGSGQLAALTTTNTFTLGDFCGFVAETANTDGLDRYRTFVDNILVQASGATGYVAENTATSYVYTYVNDQSEESAPSFASATVLRPSGIAITVTTPTDVPTGISSEWHIETKRIYRSVQGATGTIFRFVAEVPLAQAEYVDNIPDTELGEALESEGWALPPVGMRGILALPNGTMAGFDGNELCLSAQNRPHAWPLDNRYAVDTQIVAIGNIDATVVLGTQSFPYLAIGTNPGAYSMTKLEVPQACVSKRSLAYLIGFGVVFASPDGLIAVAGNGNVRNLTSGVFTRKQWQAMVPESILGVAHDDVYHFFYDNDVAPPAGPYFEDLFDGPAGTIAGHIPDHAPSGFEWPGGEHFVPRLTGTGSATSNAGNYSYSENTDGDVLWTPLEVGAVWRIEMNATASNGSSEDETFALFQITCDDGLGAQKYINLTLFALEGGVGSVSVETLDNSFEVETTEGAHFLRVTVSPTGIALSIDGVPSGGFSEDMTDMVRMVGASVQYDGAPADCQAQRVAMYPQGSY